jgi:replicative DNA helicase
MQRKIATPDELLGGKMQPSAPELEEAILGALMIDKDAFLEAQSLLKADYFYRDRCQIIYKAIVNLFNNSEPIDVLTVIEETRKMGKLEAVGGEYYISSLTLKVTSAANIKSWCAVVTQKAVGRALINDLSLAVSSAYDPSIDVFEVIAKTELKLMGMTAEVMKKDVTHAVDISDKLIEQMLLPATEMLGIPSGLHELDQMTGGFKDSNFIIIAARPSVGKSVLAANFVAQSAIHSNKPAALFSLEMSSEEFLMRIYASETDIPGYKLSKRMLNQNDWVKIHKFRDILAQKQLFIDDTPSISLLELKSKAIRLKQKHDISMIVIDYIQLMKGNGSYGTREQEVSDISRGLKSLAKELRIPVIGLAQLSRSVETRADKRPILSDLRESGSLEMDADMVMFLTRPEMYDIPSAGINGQELCTEGLGILEVAKHRNGAVGMIPLIFHKEVSRFESYNQPMNKGFYQQ